MYYLALAGTYCHLIGYTMIAITGGKYPILSMASNNQSQMAPQIYQTILKFILLGPVTLGMIGHSFIVSKGLTV